MKNTLLFFIIENSPKANKQAPTMCFCSCAFYYFF